MSTADIYFLAMLLAVQSRARYQRTDSSLYPSCDHAAVTVGLWVLAHAAADTGTDTEAAAAPARPWASPLRG